MVVKQLSSHTNLYAYCRNIIFILVNDFIFNKFMQFFLKLFRVIFIGYKCSFIESFFNNEIF